MQFQANPYTFLPRKPCTYLHSDLNTQGCSHKQSPHRTHCRSCQNLANMTCTILRLRQTKTPTHMVCTLMNLQENTCPLDIASRSLHLH